MHERDHESAIEILCQCLALSHAPGELFRLRAGLFGNAESWRQLMSAALTCGLVPALALALETKGLLPPDIAAPATTITPSRAMRDYATALADRREAQRAALSGVVHSLNSKGILPLLVKGAPDLWCSDRQGLYAPSIDLVIDKRELALASALLAELGYRAVKPVHAPYRRRSLFASVSCPGWIELHTRSCGPRGRAWLDAAADRNLHTVSKKSAAEAALLPPHLAVAQSYLFSHDESAGHGWTHALRGVLELASALNRCSPDDLERLHGAVSASPLMLGVIDLGIAAAADRFGFAPRLPFSVEVDAAARWRHWMNGRESDSIGSRVRLRLADIRMAFDRGRLNRAAPKSARWRTRLATVRRGFGLSTR